VGALFTAGSLCAQPAQRLNDAFRELVIAGNYSWQVLQETEVSGRSHIETAALGTTVIDGVTLGDFGGVQLACDEQHAAIFVAGGWRNVRELSREQIMAALPRGPASTAMPLLLALTRGKEFVYTPIHDWLQWVVRNAAGTFEFEGALTSDVPVAAERYFLTGELAPSRAGPSASGATATLRVWLDHGELVKCSVESSHANALSPGAAPRVTTFTVLFSRIGATRVELPAEVKALFAAPRR
jgi:hypothetical protein